MIYPATVVFNGILGILGFVSFIYLFYFKKGEKNEAIRNYCNAFFFFFLYNLFLIIPLIIFKELNPITGLFYNFALLSLGICTWYGFKISLNLRVTSESLRLVASAVYIVGIVLSVLPNFIFLEIPIGSDNGKWVVWHSRDIANYFYLAFIFVSGWTFAYINLEAFLKVSSSILKARVILYALSGFLLPFSAAYYFGASSLKEIYISFVLAVSAMFLFAVGNVVLGALLTRGDS